MAASAPRPLLEKPIVRVFPIVGPRSAVEVEVGAFPNQRVTYKVTWTKLPPAGISAMVEGQVVLHKTTFGRRGDTLRKLLARSNGVVYQPGNGGDLMHIYQLDHVDDIDFRGAIREGVF